MSAPDVRFNRENVVPITQRVRQNQATTDMQQIAISTDSKIESKSAFDRVSMMVSAAASVLPGVTAAVVRDDGLEFWLLGPTWHHDLAVAGGELAAEIQRRLSADGDVYINGGFAVDHVEYRKRHWIVTYERVSDDS